MVACEMGVDYHLFDFNDGGIEDKEENDQNNHTQDI